MQTNTYATLIVLSIVETKIFQIGIVCIISFTSASPT